MNTILRAGFAFALCAAAAACSSTTTTTADATPVAAAPVTAFDGVYHGRLTRVRTPMHHLRAVCSATRFVTIKVANGALTYAQSKKVVFGSDVAADGTFAATTGDETLKGAIANGHITGALDGKECGYSLAAGLPHAKVDAN